MMRIFRLLALTLGLLTSTNALAQTPQELYEQGMQALQSGRYQEAASTLDASYRANPVPLVLYNLGLAYSGMGHPDQAVQALEAYTQAADPQREGRTIQAVQQEVQRIRDAHGRFNVALSPPDAVIEIDGVAQTPRDGKLWVPIGQRRFLIRATGHETYQQTLDVQAGDFDLEIKLRLPSGPPKARADALIDEGVALQASGNFPGAIEKYQQARIILETPRGAGQMGLAQEQTGDFGRAEENLGLALNSPRDPWVRENSRKLRQALERVQGQLATLNVSGTPDNAEVFVNGRSIGKLPFGQPVRVVSGHLTVRATHDGYNVWEQTIDLPTGSSSMLRIEMTKEAAVPLVAPIAIGEQPPVEQAPPPPPPQEPVATKPTQTDIEANVRPEDEGEPPDEHPTQTGFEMQINFGYQLAVGGPKTGGPGAGDQLGEGSSGAIVPLQLNLGARILWPISFGFQLNTGLDLGTDGAKVGLNGTAGLYVRGHASRDKKALGWDVWGGVGIHPFAMQALLLEADTLTNEQLAMIAQSDPQAAQLAAAQQQTGVDRAVTVQSINVPLELGGTFFITGGFGLNLAMALTFWLPQSVCVHDESDRLCFDSNLDTQTSFFIGGGLAFLP